MIFRVLYEKYFMLSFYVAQGMCNECVEDRGGLQCSASIIVVKYSTKEYMTEEIFLHKKYDNNMWQTLC